MNASETASFLLLNKGFDPKKWYNYAHLNF